VAEISQFSVFLKKFLCITEVSFNRIREGTVPFFMLASIDNTIAIAILVVTGIALPVFGFFLAPEFSQALLPAQVSSRNDHGKGTEGAEGDLIIYQSINKFPSSDGANLDTMETSGKQKSRDDASTDSSYERSNDDLENGNSDYEKENLLLNGVPNIEIILPPDKLTSGEIVSVPGESGMDSLIVRGDPLDPTEYLVCTSNRINYECVSHLYPAGKK
jgi:hypothetical protein